MFKIVTYNYKNIDFNEWEIKNNFPCLYIIENGKDAYIGETTDIIIRVKKHLKDSEKAKYNFSKIHIIFGSNFNESITSHYENMLIKLMLADRKFNITNENNGYKKHFYKNKTASELQFDKLWLLLEQHNLVKHKDSNNLLNSNAFKYSPYNALGKEQEKALTSIINVLNYEETLPNAKEPLNRPILVSGDAGTGKTVVASVLYNYLKTNENFKNKKIAFVVPNTTTRREVMDIFKPIKAIKNSDIISPAQVYKENYDILLCDEAHKLRRNKNLNKYSYTFHKTNKTLGFSKYNDELDWLMKQTKILILFYDSKQIVRPSEIPEESFYDRLNSHERWF